MTGGRRVTIGLVQPSSLEVLGGTLRNWPVGLAVKKETGLARELNLYEGKNRGMNTVS